MIGKNNQLDDLDIATEEVISLIMNENVTTETIHHDDEYSGFEGLISGSSYLSEEQVREMLSKLDPSMSNDEWVKVGMALHDWHPIDGLPMWEEWSKGVANYDEGETAKRWKSFDVNGGVTMGTVSHMVKEVEWDQEHQRVTTYIRRIQCANQKTLEFDVFRELRKQTFNNLQRERLVKAIQVRYKELTDVKLPVSNIRQQIAKEEVLSGHFIDDSEQPEWCKDWYYINSHACFINLITLEQHKSESFNIINGKYVPTSESGSKSPAVKYVADRGYVDYANHIAYLPTYDGVICELDGLRVVNSFNPNSVPEAAKQYTDDGLLAIKRIEKHIRFICGNDDNAHIFTQWIAHQIQFPGKKIPWSPVIQSIQGAGKSFFGELLRVCLGDRNVGTVSPTQVTSDFNGWATNVVVNVLEELRVKGHNRHEAVNALKPLITERMIQINDKGVKQFMTYNTTNYICFTNYKDAIPMDADDRRWWVIFVEVDSLDKLDEIVGESTIVYFPKLFGAVREHAQELRKWLMEYDITKKFLNTKQAPMTDFKQRMIATEENNLEGLDEVRELIKEGGAYYNDMVISSVDLFDALIIKHIRLCITSTHEKNAILKKLGYMLHPKAVKIDGHVKKIWTKKALSNMEIRMHMKRSPEVSEEEVLDDFKK